MNPTGIFKGISRMLRAIPSTIATHTYTPFRFSGRNPQGGELRESCAAGSRQPSKAARAADANSPRVYCRGVAV